MMGGDDFKVPMLPNKMTLVSTENKSEPLRVSNLKAPIMLLTSHEEEIFAARFSTDGTCLTTAGFDQNLLVTAAPDKTVRVWDMETGACLRKFKSQVDIVNSCHPSRPQLVCSAGDVKISSILRANKLWSMDAVHLKTSIRVPIGSDSPRTSNVRVSKSALRSSKACGGEGGTPTRKLERYSEPNRHRYKHQHYSRIDTAINTTRTTD